MASCPDADNSWVLAGSESLPVETLGPGSRVVLETERPPPAPRSPSRSAAEPGNINGEDTVSQSSDSQAGSDPPGEAQAQGILEAEGHDMGPPGPGDTELPGDSEEPLLEKPPVEKHPGEADLDTPALEETPVSGDTGHQSQPSLHKAAWLRTEAQRSSSDDDTDVDVEGLRRRRGRDPGPPQPVASLGVAELAGQEEAGGELSISLNMCLLGALVLLGLGILLFSGGLSESDSGPATEEAEVQAFVDSEGPDARGAGQVGPRQQPSAIPDGAPSLQSMALLLDKLAKENQDIRLLQAQLQDFVDALEDSLEEVAVRQTGDDDVVDDFEDFIFSHFFGDKALKKRSGKKDKNTWSPRVVGPREEHSQHHRG